MAAHRVYEVTRRAELDAVAECIWDVFVEDAAHKIFFQARDSPEASLADCQERLWQEHTNDPSSHWIFVRDPAPPTPSADKTSPPLRVLGACQWRFYEQNPFPDGAPSFTADWWPPGEERDFATEFVKQNMIPRATWMARPHSGLSWCVVRTESRRQAIGRALMEWGVQQTDALGLESFIEASQTGRKLYEAMGYRVIATVTVDMSGKGNGTQWQRMEQTTLPFSCDAMWRPVHGVWLSGEPERTWKDRRQA